MRLNSLQSLGALKQLRSVPTLKPLIIQKPFIAKDALSEIEFLLHSQNLCLFTMRLLYNEISVNNRENVLTMAMQEMYKLNTILSRNDNKEAITNKEARETFKRLGVKPKHLKA